MGVFLPGAEVTTDQRGTGRSRTSNRARRARTGFRFTSMMLNQGELDGIRLLGRKTVELMTMNHLPDGQDLTKLALPGMFTETAYGGVGFGLGFSVMLSPTRAQISGTPGEFAWGGAASTAFWIDPVEDLIVIFMTQLMPSSSYPLRRELRALAYSALE